MSDFDTRLLDLLPDPIVIVDDEREVIAINGAAVALMGEQLIGRNLALALRHPEILETVDSILAGEETDHSCQITMPVPVARHFEARVSALPDDMPGLGRAILVLHDITTAMGAEQMRADFVANVSHELRSPLSSLVGFIQTLSGPARDDTEARERFLGIMESEAARMSRLIEDLLSLSKLEANEHVPPEGRVDLARLVRGVGDSLAVRAAERGMTLRIDCADDTPAVTGDPDELTKVIQNLLDNAISYAPPDSEVGVAVAAVERIPVTGLPGLSISVHNAGEGIAPEHLPRLTERFYRVDKARSRSTGGTGLGLAIVKHVVNHHRGHLAIDSAPGEGATFTVYLPTE
jgi:two-component system phosphate regulon sensor histidine kinase PhoR